MRSDVRKLLSASTAVALAFGVGRAAFAQDAVTRLDEISVRQEAAAVSPPRTAPVEGPSARSENGVGVVPPGLIGPNEGGGKGPVDGFVARASTAGTKTATPLVETPQSVTVIGQDRIETFQATSSSEVFRYTPGISADVYGADSRSDNYLTIRGLPANFFQDNLRLPLTRPYGSYRVDPFFSERIEILRGPSSIIYGQGGPGGTVNYVSKRPYPSEFNVLEYQIGNFNLPRIAFDKGGRITEDGVWSYRLAGVGANEALRGGNPFYGQRLALAPSLAWRPDSQTSLILFSSFLRDDTSTDANFLPARGTVLPNPNGRIARNLFTGDPGFDKYIKSQFAIGYEFEHRFDAVFTARQNVRYAGVETNINTVYGAGLSFADPDQRTLDRFAIGGNVSARALTVDNQLQAEFGIGPTRHTMLVGVDYLNQISFDKQNFRFGGALDLFSGVGRSIPPADPIVVRNENQNIQQVGLYFQDQMRILDRLILTGGLRYDTAFSDFRDTLPGGSNAANSIDTALSPRVAATFLLDGGVAPYVSYATSFSVNPGSAATLFPDAAPGTPFAPSRGVQEEVGIKYQPPGTPILLSASTFDITQTNVITTFGGFNSYAEDLRSRGYEVEALVELGGFRLIGAYTLQDVRVIRSDTFPEDVGGRPVAVPDRIGQIYLDYTIPAGDFRGLRFGGGMRYNGGSVGGTDFFLDDPARVRVPEFYVFDVNVAYAYENWRFSLNVFNLADRKYVAACGDPTSCFYGPDRKVIAGVRYAW